MAVLIVGRLKQYHGGVTPNEEPEPRAGRTLRRLARVRGVRWVVAAGVVVVLLASGLGVFATILAGSAPTWWRSVNTAASATQELGVAFENAVSNQLTRVRPADASLQPGERWQSEPWGIAIEPKEVNAWLNARMPGWLESRGDLEQWPDELEQLQVDFDQGLIRVGLQVTTPKGSQIVTAHLRPRVDEQGAVWLPAERLDIGRLPLPASWVLPSAEGWASDAVPTEFGERADLSTIFGLLRGIASRNEPVVPLPDGRQVRLLDVRARDGRLELTCRTEAR